jgi:hypothetical protein
VNKKLTIAVIGEDKQALYLALTIIRDLLDEGLTHSKSASPSIAFKFSISETESEDLFE